MKNVLKSAEPEALAAYRERFIRQPTPRTWEEFKKTQESKEVALQLRSDQKGLCAYCEIDLTERDSSVEHFVPKSTSTKEQNWHLEWSNLLAVCLGGIHDVGDEELPGYRKCLGGYREPSCGAKKLSAIPDPQTLNPLLLPAFPRLRRVANADGELQPDDTECAKAGVAPGDVTHTVLFLGLNCYRLCRNRLAVLQELEQDLDDRFAANPDSKTVEKEMATEMFGDGASDWPAFFTTYRSFFGVAAEEHLHEIGYTG